MQFYSICADGRIQKGVNHVDPSLAFMDEMDLDAINRFNERMMAKSSERNSRYDMWRIGEKFVNVEQDSVEFTMNQAAVPCDTGVYTLHTAKLREDPQPTGLRAERPYLQCWPRRSPPRRASLSLLPAGQPRCSFTFCREGCGKAAEYSRENVLSMDSLEFARRCAFCLFHALQGTGLISRILIERISISQGARTGPSASS